MEKKVNLSIDCEISQKKRTLINDSVHVFQFVYLYGHFYPFWASGGLWGALGGAGILAGVLEGPHE